ncbi:Fumarate hydratase class II [Gimesia maris]|uniref:Fumarate hydratase class II n=1 Tax=Gimesia maris TaxID=122 RepID=A0A3D3R003_9PLAN|nr:class II fumarate hydratase [Gimesia maris]MAC55979.1 aspartate ammonia-lyase [Gimesia sp.]QDT76825.1 Fumarate hydratase class II [Gimesia maris]QDU12462.1 Fumarate hydratase class II [Gimesia maris]HCO22069.1 aspartate ammonia-lyase [Gimesia maris]
MSGFRTERDSMGEVQVPAEAYYGAQTQRAVENFQISGNTLPPSLIHAMGQVKLAAAHANRDIGKLAGSGKNPLNDEQIKALIDAATEVADGKFDDQFPIDVYQTGSGTSSNMNVNEVISNRAIEILGQDRFAPEKSVHPNDHVNMGQSTNDTFPTAIHVAVASSIHNHLIPGLEKLAASLAQKARDWDQIIKIGRTHLADATPLRLGQEFGGFARQLELSVERAYQAAAAVYELPVGGTAVGSGINTHPEFGHRVSVELAKLTGISFVEAADHFEANAQRDGLVECHAILKTIATTLFNVSNNIRWLGSGPRCGFYEVKIPDLQPGSSIMPGKVNPVMCESMMQASTRVIGNDQTITMSGAAGGQFQLNIMMPVMGFTVLESIHLLANSSNEFVRLCSDNMEANEEACNAAVENSLSMVTSLNPHIGYEKASALAKEAFKSGKTIRELCTEQEILPAETLKEALDPMSMTEPHA